MLIDRFNSISPNEVDKRNKNGQNASVGGLRSPGYANVLMLIRELEMQIFLEKFKKCLTCNLFWMSEIVFYHRTKSASFSSFSVSEGNIESDLVEALTTFERLLKGDEVASQISEVLLIAVVRRIMFT